MRGFAPGFGFNLPKRSSPGAAIWYDDTQYDLMSWSWDAVNQRGFKPPQGSELVVNGNFATDPTLGSDIILNGDFSVAATGNPATGWATFTAGTSTAVISGGILTLTPDGTNSCGVDQSLTTVIGQLYEMTVTIGTNGVGVQIGTTQGGTQLSGATLVAAVGTRVIRFTATATTTWLRFSKTSATVATVDNVSVKPVTNNGAGGLGWFLKANNTGQEQVTIAGGTLNLTGDGSVSAFVDQSFTTVANTVYGITFTAGATVVVTAGTTQGGTTLLNATNAGGTNTYYFLATGTTTWIRLSRTPTGAQPVDDVSIKALDTTKVAGKYPKEPASFTDLFALTAGGLQGARSLARQDGTIGTMADFMNLMVFSEDPTNWNPTSGTLVTGPSTAPNGGPTGLFTENAPTTQHAVSSPNYSAATGIQYTASWVVKAGTCDRVQITPGSAIAAAVPFANFYLNGAGSITNSGTGNSASFTIEALANGFYRISITWSATANAPGAINLYALSTGAEGRAPAIAGTSRNFEMSEVMVVTGPVVSRYLKTTSAQIDGANNQPRYTYVNGRSELRLEDARTNIATQSEDFTQAVWGLDNMTSSVVSSWTLMRETTATNFHRAGRSNPTGNLTLTNGVTYTVSALVRKAGRRYVGFRSDGRAVGNFEQIFFDLDTGTVSYTDPDWTSTIKAHPSGGYIISGTFTATASPGAGFSVVASNAAVSDNTIPSYTGDTAQGYDVRYMQFEVGAFASDYMPTGAIATTRAREDALLALAPLAGLQGANGSVVARAQLTNTAALGRRILGATTTNTLLHAPGTGTQISANTGGTILDVTIPASGSPLQPFGAGLAYNAGGRSVSANGAVASDANTAPVRTSAWLGRDATLTAGTFGDGYYHFFGLSVERVSNAQLQTWAVAVLAPETPGGHLGGVDPSLAGVWTWFNDPRAIKVGANLVVGGIKSDGSPHVGVSGGTPVILKSAMEVDDHDNPALLRMSSGKILAHYSRHSADASYFQRISTNVDDVSTFDAETDIGSVLGAGLTQKAYANLVEITDGIFNFFRAVSGAQPRTMHYTKSTDLGVNWAAGIRLLTGDRPYFKIIKNGANRIDFLVNDGHPGEAANNSTYHFYYDAGTWKNSAGTSLGAVPFTPSSQLTRIFDGSTPAGISWVHDIRPDSAGNPVGVFAVFPTVADHRYYYCRWSGSAWSYAEICTAGGSLYDTAGVQDYYSGGITIDPDDVNTIYCSRKIDGAFNIWKGVTINQGASWTMTQLTFGDALEKRFRPFKVPGTTSLLYVVGTYTTYTNFNTRLATLDLVRPNAPTLAALTLASTTFAASIAFNRVILGKTTGSLITATSSDGTVLTVAGNILQGTFAASGSPTITLTETVVGGLGSPRISTIPVTVAGSPFDSFTTTGTPPPLWTPRWVTAGSVWSGNDGGNGYLRSTPPSSARRALSFDTAGSVADIELLFKVRSSTKTAGQAFMGLIARGSGAAASETGYYLRFDESPGQELRFGRYLAGASLNISQPSVAWVANTYYWVRFRLIGTSIKVRFWAHGSGEPGTWIIDTTNADIAAAGWAGIADFGPSGNRDYDYFSYAVGGGTAP